ncbi:shikimate dehydrogenase [soil metagenome]
MTGPRLFLQGLVGVFGDPVAENPTQAMIEAAFADMGLDWRYLTVQVASDRLGDAVRGARAMGWKGFNCTIPHKVSVLEHLDRLSPAAERIGAVNCVVLQDGQALGENTDGKGFLRSVEPLRPVQGSRVVLLGAGGAARAIGVELALAGAAHLSIVNRTPRRGQELATLIRDRTGVPTDFRLWEGQYTIPAGTNLVINATSIGLFPDVNAVVPIDFDSLDPEMLVCDVIPNPPRTHLLRSAESRGCAVLDGLDMLVNQGVIGIQLWTGRTPRPEVMRNALKSVFEP